VVAVLVAVVVVVVAISVVVEAVAVVIPVGLRSRTHRQKARGPVLCVLGVVRPEAACQGSHPVVVASQRKCVQNVQRGMSSLLAVAQLQAMFDDSHLVGCSNSRSAASVQGARIWLLAIAQSLIIVAIAVADAGVTPARASSRRCCFRCCCRRRYRRSRRRRCRYLVVVVMVIVIVVVVLSS